MDIVDSILSEEGNVFLTGPGGTGKSYIIKEIVKRVGDQCICTASTGIAAIPIDGVTLHRALGLGLFKGNVNSLYAQMQKKKGLLQKWRTAGTLIIDEVSMADISVLVRMSLLLSIVRDDERPMGGMKVILSGDFLQLPPVEKYEEDGKKYTYIFEHPLWKKLDLKPIILDTPHRFATREFFDILSDARHGILSERLKDMAEFCNRKPVKHETGIIPTVVFCVNDDVDKYNTSKLGQLPGELVSYPATYRSSFRGEEFTTKKDMKQYLLKGTRVQDNLELKVGAQVMLMINTLHDSLCNGSRGVVVGFDKVPIVRFLNGLELPVKINTWTSGSPREIDGKLEWESHRVVQIPLRLAYAATAHKTQGMTLDSALICVDKGFVPNHIYVMLSRCRDKEFIFMKGWSEEKFLECGPDRKVLKFYEKLRSQV